MNPDFRDLSAMDVLGRVSANLETIEHLLFCIDTDVDYDWLFLRPEFKNRVEKMRQDAKDLGFMVALAKDRLEQFMGVSE